MSEVSEISSIMGTMKTWYENQAGYLEATNSIPEVSTLASNMDFSELLTLCSTEAHKGAGYPIGAAQEAIYTGAAIVREVDISKYNKNVIYADHTGECSDESLFFGQAENYLIGVIKGSPTNGSQC